MTCLATLPARGALLERFDSGLLLLRGHLALAAKTFASSEGIRSEAGVTLLLCPLVGAEGFALGLQHFRCILKGFLVLAVQAIVLHVM